MAVLQSICRDQIILFFVTCSFVRSCLIGQLCVCGEIRKTTHKSNPHTHTHTHTHTQTHTEGKNLRKSWWAQYRQFLGKKFKPNLIIRSPGTKHASELKEIISNTLTNMQSLIHMIRGNVTSFILPWVWVRFSVELPVLWLNQAPVGQMHWTVDECKEKLHVVLIILTRVICLWFFTYLRALGPTILRFKHNKTYLVMGHMFRFIYLEGGSLL